MSFVDAHDFSVGLVLRVLGIPASTYYDWRRARRAPSRRAREDAELLGLVDEIRGDFVPTSAVSGHTRAF